jgi:hypothetical protein
VIGILFEKKGEDIKQAIFARMDIIVKKITEYKSISQKIEEFIERKRIVLKGLDDFYQGRSDEKDALIMPFKRKIEETVKKCNDEVFSFDRTTQKQLGEKALTFEDGFDAFKLNFEELDLFLKKEREIIEPIRGVGFGNDISVRGYHGQTGIQGCTGTQGTSDVSGSEPELEYGLQESTEEEDKAYARLSTIRNLLRKYEEKLNVLKNVVRSLEDELRRLTLIRDNIEDQRNYKLDLNKLSALGFEDLKV